MILFAVTHIHSHITLNCIVDINRSDGYKKTISSGPVTRAYEHMTYIVIVN